METALHMSERIAAGIKSGEFVQDGGVVRDHMGRLVALLKGASLPEEAQGAAGSVVTALSKSTAIAIGLGAAAAATTGVAGYLLGKIRRKQPNTVGNCIAALNAYLETERLDVETVDRLNATLNAVKREAADGSIEISVDQLETLVAIVADRTRELAEANAVDLSEAAQIEGGEIVDLQRHLSMQKRILKRCA